MQNVVTWQDAILVAGTTVLNQLVSFLPNLFGAVLIIMVGRIVAGWTKSLVVGMLKTAKLNKVVKDTAVDAFLKKAEWKGQVEEIFGNIAKWLTLLIFFIAAINVLGLTTVTQVLNEILAYIPRVISAALILLAGVLLAGAVEGVVKGATGAVDASTSRMLGKLTSWIVMIFATLAAISELGIAAHVINTLITGVVATLTLGLGLALGLGSKDLVSKILTEWYQGIRQDLKKK